MSWRRSSWCWAVFVALFSFLFELLPIVDSFCAVGSVGSTSKQHHALLVLVMAKRSKTTASGGPSSEESGTNNDDKNAWESLPAELLPDVDDEGDDDDEDWIPDRHKNRPSPYTDEEEALIEAMGGKQQKKDRTYRREDGYLGDSTLEDICTDYSVPICYLADVLCTWGIPIPINPQSMLGDLVTGEQAFAVLEAINSLDVSALYDRYSDFSLQQVCNEWDINLNDAFSLAMKEGWNLPFGVQTFLRTDQERELLRVMVDPDAIRMEPLRGDPYEDENIYFEQNA
jgi:hypothetical protein